MSRLRAYLAAKTLAGLHMKEAQLSAVGSSDAMQKRALTHLIKTVEIMLVAMNNLASMHFHEKKNLPRPRSTKKAKPKDGVVYAAGVEQ